MIWVQRCSLYQVFILMIVGQLLVCSSDVIRPHFLFSGDDSLLKLAQYLKQKTCAFSEKIAVTFEHFFVAENRFDHICNIKQRSRSMWQNWWWTQWKSLVTAFVEFQMSSVYNSKWQSKSSIVVLTSHRVSKRQYKDFTPEWLTTHNQMQTRWA